MLELEIRNAHQKINEYKSAWHGMVPSSRFDWFVERVKMAVEIYYMLSEPANLSAELKKIEKISKRHPAELPLLIENASPMVQEILTRDGALPSLPDADDGASLAEFAYDIRSRIVIAEYWVKEGQKRRKKVKTGNALPFKRPKQEKINILVSLVASALSSANGEASKRSWSGEMKSPIEAILGDVFDVLNIDGTHSVNEALRRHIENRKLLEQPVKS